MRTALALALVALCAACASPSGAPAQAAVPPTIDDRGLALAYRLTDSQGVMFYVFLNPDTQTHRFTVDRDLSGGSVVVDRTRAGTSALTSPQGISVQGTTVTVDREVSAVIRWP